MTITPTTQPTTRAAPTRVETVPLPRVMPIELPSVAVIPWMVVACPTKAVVASHKNDLHQSPPNYISQDEEQIEVLAHNTRSK